MSDDIVTRLRESAEFWSSTEYGADFAKCAEAADEIERLRRLTSELAQILMPLSLLMTTEEQQKVIKLVRNGL